MLLAEIIGSKYETMETLLKKDWTAVEMTKKKIMDQVNHI